MASWELRVDRYRFSYEVSELLRKVVVVAIGHKEHEKLYIAGKEVKL